MADTYCDLTGSGSATSPYDTWAKAASDIQTALTQAGAGGRCFVKTSATATANKDTAAAARILTSPGTALSLTEIYGCKNGTTNEPPVTSDLVVRDDADMPIFEATGANSDFTPAGVSHCYGIEFLIGENFEANSSAAYWVFEECEITLGIDDTISGFYVGGTASANYYVHLVNTNVNFTNSGDDFTFETNSAFSWHGGVLGGTAPTYLIDDHIEGSGLFFGVDLSLVSGSLVDATGTLNCDVRFISCEIHASVSLTGGTFGENSSRVVMQNCSSSTAISTSVIALDEATAQGTVSSETTRVRTGGADDGAAGDFSWAMLPNANAPSFPSITLRSPPMAIWLDGTETTVTVYIANDSASTDMQDDEVWLDVWASDSTLDTAQYVLNSDRMAVLGTPANQTDDTGSTWGSGANNHQTLAVTIAPGYEGWALCYVHCAERAASPKTVYVDPLPVLS